MLFIAYYLKFHNYKISENFKSIKLISPPISHISNTNDERDLKRGLIFISTQMMKKRILSYRMILISLIIFSLFTGTVLFLLKPISYYYLLSMACVMIFVLVFYVFVNINIFEYENSMQFISIKQSYFWRLNRKLSPIEFPNDKLAGFSVNKVLYLTSVMLQVRSKEQKIKTLYCKIAGLDKGQIFELKQ